MAEKLRKSPVQVDKTATDRPFQIAKTMGKKTTKQMDPATAKAGDTAFQTKGPTAN